LSFGLSGFEGRSPTSGAPELGVPVAASARWLAHSDQLNIVRREAEP
jgi:hypothetical protein